MTDYFADEAPELKRQLNNHSLGKNVIQRYEDSIRVQHKSTFTPFDIYFSNLQEDLSRAQLFAELNHLPNAARMQRQLESVTTLRPSDKERRKREDIEFNCFASQDYLENIKDSAQRIQSTVAKIDREFEWMNFMLASKSLPPGNPMHEQFKHFRNQFSCTSRPRSDHFIQINRLYEDMGHDLKEFFRMTKTTNPSAGGGEDDPVVAASQNRLMRNPRIEIGEWKKTALPAATGKDEDTLLTGARYAQTRLYPSAKYGIFEIMLSLGVAAGEYTAMSEKVQKKLYPARNKPGTQVNDFRRVSPEKAEELLKLQEINSPERTAEVLKLQGESSNVVRLGARNSTDMGRS